MGEYGTFWDDGGGVLSHAGLGQVSYTERFQRVRPNTRNMARLWSVVLCLGVMCLAVSRSNQQSPR